MCVIQCILTVLVLYGAVQGWATEQQQQQVALAPHHPWPAATGALHPMPMAGQVPACMEEGPLVGQVGRASMAAHPMACSSRMVVGQVVPACMAVGQVGRVARNVSDI